MSLEVEFTVRVTQVNCSDKSVGCVVVMVHLIYAAKDIFLATNCCEHRNDQTSLAALYSRPELESSKRISFIPRYWQWVAMACLECAAESFCSNNAAHTCADSYFREGDLQGRTHCIVVNTQILYAHIPYEYTACQCMLVLGGSAAMIPCTSSTSTSTASKALPQE